MPNFTPTQAKLLVALREGPKTKFELEEALGKKLEGCSESLIKTQICLINRPYRPNKIIVGQIDSNTGDRKYYLVEHTEDEKIKKAIEELQNETENMKLSICDISNKHILSIGISTLALVIVIIDFIVK